MFEIRVPASTSNLGAGFDALSLALKMYLRLRIEKTGSDHVFESEHGEFQFDPAENYVLKSARETAARFDKEVPGYRVVLVDGIPVGRGLGSSASALVAGIRIADRLCGLHLSDQQAIEIATEMEGHPDNVTAALFGGLVLSAQSDGHVICRRFLLPTSLRFVAVLPDFQILTRDARAVLPQNYSRADVIHNVQRAALLAALLATGDFPFDREILADRIHQPYRAKLVPGLEELVALESDGLVGVTLSGAGPTVLLWCHENHETAAQAAVQVFEKHGVKSRYVILEVDNQGAVIE